MLLSCHSCEKEYVASPKLSHEPFICSKCQARDREPLIANTKLGLHPALERKYAHAGDEKKKRLTQAPLVNISHVNHRDLSALPLIPGFDISYQVGRGAMGSVYKAREKKSGRLVAIKVLSNELCQRSDLVARFEREAYALKSLSDPNVVTIIDAGHQDSVHYFAMEFIDGITLRTRMNRGAINLEQAAFISNGILRGLKAAHQHGIIHRDLKPENVLLAYSGPDYSGMPDRVVLVDFGLVGIGGLAFDPHPNLTRSRVTMGTVNYMAPEQHIDAKRVDHRSDLYSAGVIFFEMLSKDLPLGRYLLPAERGLDVPEQVDIVLARSLARAPEQRYSSAQEFIDELENLMGEKDNNKDKIEASFLESNIFLQARQAFYRVRYPALLGLAALFFCLGIKLSFSLPASPDKPVATKKHK